uniref:hypothetical protein n=1 Tax=Alistipes sp. TaxID=1872444 RepID=UPI004055E968
MKKILMSLAAVAALVGCTKEAPIANTETKEALSIVASIDLSETRVSVEGEKFTDVKWEMGDEVALSSAAGASATLKATASGDTDIRFEGEGSFAADVDTYYAVYPATEIAGGVATFDLASQLGDDAAVLAAKAEDVAKGSIPMTFKPVNALLHVKVTGIAELAKAEFMAYNGATLAQGFTYNVASDATMPYGDVAAYTITNPAAEGFFFSLPADLNMAEGYVVRLTDANGNVCSKAYNGKTFAAATTTRVEIAWSQPTVTLGAKTSYSYYLLNQPASANSCANNVIYFSGDCATTYAGIQNVYVSEVGFYVDGTKYSSAAGQVNWNKGSKSFSMSNITAANGGHNVKAYIVTEEHGTIESESTLYITGLPYTLNVSSNDGTWTESGNIAWNNSSAVRLGYNLSNWFAPTSASIKKTSGFSLPANVNVSVSCTGQTSGTSAQTTTFTVKVSDTSIFSVTSGKSTSRASFTMSPTPGVMNANNATIECHNSRGTSTAASYVQSLFVGYGNK